MSARHDLIVSLCPGDRPVIDVGADHGYVAEALGAIATERLPHRAGRAAVRWVIADGLAPFREVPVAILAGMGARTIAAILERGPRPGVLVAHAPDRPGHLRRWLAGHGWRIDAEGLAREGRGFAEVLRAVPGRETAEGLALTLGPRLLEGDDPLLEAWLRHRHHHAAGVAHRTRGADPDAFEAADARRRFLEAHLQERGWPIDA